MAWGLDPPDREMAFPVDYLAIGSLFQKCHRYLEEWLEHHFSPGFSHIYLFDTEGEGSLESVVVELGLEDKVTVEP